MKHKREAGCSPPILVREEIFAHGEQVRKAHTLEQLEAVVAPGGKIVYDIATAVDSEYPPFRYSNLFILHALTNKSVSSIELEWLSVNHEEQESSRGISPFSADEIDTTIQNPETRPCTSPLTKADHNTPPYKHRNYIV